MDGFVTIDRVRRLDVLVDQPWPGIAQVGRLGWMRVEHDNQLDPGAWKDPVAVIQVCLAGSGWIETGGVRRPLPGGNILLFNSMEHQLRYGFDHTPAESWEYCWADLTGDCARSAIRELVRRRGNVIPGGATVAATILRQLPTAGTRQAAWPTERAAQVAWEILAALFGEQPGDMTSPLAARAMAWLEAHMALPAGVAAAAAALGITREHLTRSFRAEVGIPPGTWLRQRRLERAQLLLASGLEVSEAATRVGFASRSHFAAAFRHQHGTNPRR